MDLRLKKQKFIVLICIKENWSEEKQVWVGTVCDRQYSSVFNYYRKETSCLLAIRIKKKILGQEW